MESGRHRLERVGPDPKGTRARSLGTTETHPPWILRCVGDESLCKNILTVAQGNGTILWQIGIHLRPRGGGNGLEGFGRLDGKAFGI